MTKEQHKKVKIILNKFLRNYDKVLYGIPILNKNIIKLLDYVFEDKGDQEDYLAGFRFAGYTVDKHKSGREAFHIIRSNRSTESFSFSNYGKSQRWKVSQALRLTIEDQKKDFRIKNNVPKDFDVDHVMPFRDLVSAWLKQNNLTYDDVKTHKSYLKDDNLTKSWQEFHRKHATLQGLSKEDHLKKTKNDMRRS